MKKRVLIIISSFRWGGINRALQNWLNAISPDEYQVDLFVLVHSGNYEGTFSNCELLPKNKFLGTLLDQKEYQKGLAKILFLALKVLNKLTKGKFQHWLYGKSGNNLVKGKNYDAVIAWGEGVPTVFVSHIEHSNKIAWIHCDYTQYTNGPTEKTIYDKFKSIVCVSKYTRKTFLSYYPEMETKVHAIYNILDIDEIKRLSKEPMDIEYDKNVFNIVSVGRVAPVKRFSEIPAIAKKVKDAGCEFCWYIVGPYCEDKEYHKIVDDTKAFGLSGQVVMLGGKDNPYPYIANADLLVCTSISEAAPFVILEALCLKKPVVSADFGSAGEFVIDCQSGYISNIESIDKPIIGLITDSQSIQSEKDARRSFIYGNSIVLRKINCLL